MNDAVPTGCPVHDFDHWDAAQTAENVRPLYRKLREGGPVSWSERYGGFWVLARYDDVKAAASDHRRFVSSRGAFLPQTPGTPRGVALEQDPPEHRGFRRLYVDWLAPARLRAAAPMIRELTEHYVERYAAAGGGDFVGAVSAKLPVQVIGRMLGLDPDVAHEAYAITDRMTHGWDGAVGELAELARREYARRRAQPREDYLTVMLDASAGGRPVTEDERTAWLMGAFFAGHETTLLAGAALVDDLARDPGLQDRLREHPELVPAVVEDSLRANSPVQRFFRTVAEETAVGGVVMHAGDKVMLAYASANLDESRFPEPSQVRVDREFTRHLGFGWGVHRCVGAPLALRELTTLAEVMLERTRFRPDGPPRPGPPTSRGNFMGLAELPLTVERAA